ncbi:MAG: hypothetical protein WAO56_02080 [Miniphocaeibacter sp.]|uniref:hypothetical protein n=1 Tax=Miniphocaeibacter sp. TaxID=3100973 RepID=UPI0017E19464|nr:hypothetical protein [Gallicola sp.]
MTKYIRSELYRIFKKKSLYIFMGIIALGFVLINYMMLNSQSTSLDYISNTLNLLSFATIIAGIYIFNTVYNDDFNSNALNAGVGLGIKRSSIVIYKLIIMTILTIVMFAFFTLVFFLMGMMYKFKFSNLEIESLVLYTSSIIVGIIGYASLTSIIIFATQKAIYGTITYLLLCTEMVHSLVTMGLKFPPVTSLMGDRSSWLFSSLTGELAQGKYISLIGIGVYILVSIVLAILMFNKKEVEFI